MPETRVSDDIVRGFIKKAEDEKSDRSPWEQKLQTWYARRYGLRSEKHFPWKGASNLNIPLTDKIIRRMEPLFHSLVFRVNPIVSIEPLGATDVATARALEYGYDWIVRYKMKRAREALTFVNDVKMTYGFGIVKCVWEKDQQVSTRKIKTDFADEETWARLVDSPDDLAMELMQRLGLNLDDHEDLVKDAMRQFEDGDEEITVTIPDDVTYDAPRWHAIHPIDFIVPADSTTDIDRMPWCVHCVSATDHELEMSAKAGKYDPEKVRAAIEHGIMYDQPRSMVGYDHTRDQREGVTSTDGGEDHDHQLWEIYFRHDADGDGISERYVSTVHKSSGEILRTIAFPYEHSEWPFTRFHYEMTEDRWYSARGVPELVYDLQTEINAQHNAKLDNMAIQNSKSFIFRAGSIRNPSQWTWRPGAFFPVRRMDDIQPITHQVMDFSFNAEEENLRAWAEEYVGTPDFGISNINQRVERRTATEIEQIQRSTGAVAESVVEHYQESMRRLHRQTLALWGQYGDDSAVIRVAGDQAIRFNRFDLYKEFDLVPTGRMDNLDAATRAAKAFSLLQLAEAPSTAPYMNPYEIARDIVENTDYRNSSRYLREPGATDADAMQVQIDEISRMAVLGEVHPVEQGEDHQSHIAVCQQSMQANQDDPGLAQLITVHLAMHAFFLGEPQLLQQLTQQGVQVQQDGTRLVAQMPEQQQEEGAPPPQE